MLVLGAAVDRVAFSVGGFSVYWYGLLIALAVVAGVWVGMLGEKDLGFKKDTAIDLIILALPLCVIGARVYYVAFSWDEYAGDFLKMINFRQGGGAIYGSVIGGILAALIFAKWKKLSFGKILDMGAPGLVLGQAIGRWGNFFNQEAFGSEIVNPAWQFFPAGVFIESLGKWHMATFFYESMWCLLIFAFLFFYLRKRKAHDGDLFVFYLMLYGAGRAVIEGLRTDSLYLGFVRISQLLSLVLVLGSLALFYFHRLKRAGQKPTDIVLWLLSGLAVLGAIFAEYKMTASTAVTLRTLQAICFALLCAVGAAFAYVRVDKVEIDPSLRIIPIIQESKGDVKDEEE